MCNISASYSWVLFGIVVCPSGFLFIFIFKVVIFVFLFDVPSSWWLVSRQNSSLIAPSVLDVFFYFLVLNQPLKLELKVLFCDLAVLFVNGAKKELVILSSAGIAF